MKPLCSLVLAVICGACCVPAAAETAEPIGRITAHAAAEDGRARPPVVSGWVDVLGAYSYGDPRHWSRGVARLQLTAHGELAPDVRWKVGGRVDVDPVYFGSHFYPDAVKRDQRSDAIWRENYLDWSAGDLDVRLGAQQIVWGEVMGLFFADVVSARDMRDFLLPGFDVMRIPQWAARAEYTRGDGHIELVWVPVPTFDRIGKPGADFYPVPLDLRLPQAMAELFRDPERPARKLSNSNYGLRANTLIDGWDIAAFWYRSYSTAPTFYRLPGDSPSRPLIVQPRYDRISQAGATLSKDFGDFVLRGEGVYTRGQNFSTAGTSVVDAGVARRNTLDWIASVEWSLPNDSRVNLQAYQRKYRGGGDGELALRNGGTGASVFAATKVTSSVEAQVLWFHNFPHHDGLLRPRLNWNATRDVLLSFGVDVFTGPPDTFFGRYNKRDRVYGEAQLHF